MFYFWQVFHDTENDWTKRGNLNNGEALIEKFIKHLEATFVIALSNLGNTLEQSVPQLVHDGLVEVQSLDVVKVKKW